MSLSGTGQNTIGMKCLEEHFIQKPLMLLCGYCIFSSVCQLKLFSTDDQLDIYSRKVGSDPLFIDSQKWWRNSAKRLALQSYKVDQPWNEAFFYRSFQI